MVNIANSKLPQFEGVGGLLFGTSANIPTRDPVKISHVQFYFEAVLKGHNASGAEGWFNSRAERATSNESRPQIPRSTTIQIRSRI